MNEFRESLIYSNKGMYNRENGYVSRNNRSRTTNERATIKGRKTINKSRRYTPKEIMRNRLIALALAGTAALGMGIGIKGAIDRANEEKYVSNFEEINQYDIQAQQLGISQELYDEIMQFKEEINETDLTQVSNQKLAEYFGSIDDMYLTILKNKVGSIIGKSTSEFELRVPEEDGGILVDTRIVESNSERYIGMINSDEVNKYMNDILKVRSIVDRLQYGNVDRDKMEDTLKRMTEQLGEVMTINLLRDGTKEKNKLVSYRIETKELKQTDLDEKTAQVENEIEK